jgi:tetratricopeptide (TPR) repeat protein
MTKVILICLLTVACLCGCSQMFARTSPLTTSQEAHTLPPGRGLRVIEVFPNSPAEAAGIQRMDLLTQYAEYQIIDDATYFAARDKYEKSPAPTIEIVVWRGRERLTAEVPTGWLGVSTIELNRVSLEFSTLMNRINVLSQIPEHMRQHEFKKEFEDGGPTKILEKATALIDQAEQDGSLTTSQLLVAKIYLIQDDAPEEDQKRQSELLKQLLQTQPVSYIHVLGNDKFFKEQRYRAASACLNHYLRSSPDDVSMRLNLAVAYNQIGMYEAAEREVDYVFDRNLGISNYGRIVAYNAKANAALGQKDYVESIELMEKVMALEQDPSRLMIIQLAAAQMGDRARFEEASQRLKQTAPAKYQEVKLQVDAVEAHLMVKQNRRDTARQIVDAWKGDDRAEGRVTSYWKKLPDGMDVARTWAELSKQQTASK